MKHVHVAGTETCPAVGLGGLEIFAVKHTFQQVRLVTGFYVEHFFAGLNSSFVGGWGNGIHGDNLLATASKGTSSPRSNTFMAGVLQNNGFFSSSLCSG